MPCLLLTSKSTPCVTQWPARPGTTRKVGRGRKNGDLVRGFTHWKPWENHEKMVIDMEHVAFIDDLPTKNGDLPYSFLYVYKRVSPVISCYIPKKKKTYRSLGFINVYIWVINHLLSGMHIQVWSFFLDEFRRNLQELGFNPMTIFLWKFSGDRSVTEFYLIFIDEFTDLYRWILPVA